MLNLMDKGLRSGLDKVCLIAENEEMAKSITGKIEWLASHGSLRRLDAVPLGLSPDLSGSAVVAPSQKRVPAGEKIRKQAIRRREEKINKHSGPDPQQRKREIHLRPSFVRLGLTENSRPKGQKVS
jgi:hypothetical protein